MLSFNQLKKNIKKDFTEFRKIRLAVLGDSASQLLCQAIKGYGYEIQTDFEIYEADYNQIDLQIFNPHSELYNFLPDFIFINRSTEKLLKEFYETQGTQVGLFATFQQEKVLNYYNTLLAQSGAKIIINTFPEINDNIFGNYSCKTDQSFTYQTRKTNLLMMEAGQHAKNMFVLDLAGLQAEKGREFVFDSKMHIAADMVYSIDFLPVIAMNISKIIEAVSGFFKKCLVLDLDNTIWGGIIGDDGIEGIQIGPLGVGKAFVEIQLWARQLRRRGIILAVCSKNTDTVAMEPFKSHPDMVLRMDDIAVFVANWENKVDNLRYIQSVLNIGFDSMVFLDDNPFEREMVAAGIPEITVPDLPEDPAEYLPYLTSLNLFETASFTGDEDSRTKKYQEEAKRLALFKSYDNEDDFLQSLCMVSSVKPFDDFSIPRVSQLTQRSNQFNLRTVRYTEEEVKQLSVNPAYYTLSFTLEDRFGDHGLIAAVILKKLDTHTLFIETWIMSCRVLKRGMELYTLNRITELAAANNFDVIKGEYIPTKKNTIVKDLYESLGFLQDGDCWTLNVKTTKKSYIHIANKMNTN